MKTFHGNLNPKSPTLRDRDASFSPSHLDDSTSELSIFHARMYFNEVTNNDIQKVTISSNSRVSPLVNMDIEHKRRHNPERGHVTETSRSYSTSSTSVDGCANIENYKVHSSHAGTSTTSSDVSWNSQAGLLSHPPTSAISVSMRNSPHPMTDLGKKIRASLSKPIWLLRRKCPCSGKKSVQVKANTPKPKTPMPPKPTSTPPQHLSHNQIARDSLNPKTPPTDKWTTDHMETTAAKIPSTSNKAIMFLPSSRRFQLPAMNQARRPFTEGFAFPVLNPPPASATSPTKPQVVMNVVHEEDPPRDSLEVFQPPQSSVMDEDAASDASSDLFEIESFSTPTTTPAYPMTPTITECHEPREPTSIDWSAAKFFFADHTSSSSTVIHGGAGEHPPENWKRKGSPGNGLLSCRSEKAVAVRVAPPPVKSVVESAEGHGGAPITATALTSRHATQALQL